jgi:flotillin
VKGEAEAYAIEAKAKAEAEQMAKKADAWKDYQEAAMVDMVLDTLPKVLYALVLLYLRPVQNQMVKVFKGGRQG